MTAFDDLHPVVQQHIQRLPNDADDIVACGCTFRVSPIYGRGINLCRFHQGMSVGVDDALEWAELEEER